MVVVGIVICFCCRYVEDPYGMPTASACPVSWWEMMSNRPEYFPYHKLRSWLEVPRARILISPDSEIIKLNFWGVYPTPTSCAFPQMLHSLGHYPKLLLCPKSPCKINTILLINPSQSLLSLKYHPPNSHLQFGSAPNWTAPCCCHYFARLSPCALLLLSLDTTQDQAQPLLSSPWSKTKWVSKRENKTKSPSSHSGRDFKTQSAIMKRLPRWDPEGEWGEGELSSKGKKIRCMVALLL